MKFGIEIGSVNAVLYTKLSKQLGKWETSYGQTICPENPVSHEFQRDVLYCSGRQEVINIHAPLVV